MSIKTKGGFRAQVKFQNHIGWVRCGPTLVAMNLKAGYKVDWKFNDGTVINGYPVDKRIGLLEKYELRVQMLL